MRRNYDKLVRDRIPEIIRSGGKQCGIETMPEAEYRWALLEKLVEEAQEVLHAEPDELVAELADLQEVVDAVLTTWKISPDTVLQIQRQRRSERGAFQQRLKLLWTDAGSKNKNS